MFENYSAMLASEHIDDLRRDAAKARLVREARQARQARRASWPRRRRGHGLVPA
jgi:hypothetical protein